MFSHSNSLSRKNVWGYEVQCEAFRTEKKQEYVTEKVQDWKIEKVQDWVVEKVQDWKVEKVQEWKKEKKLDWKQEKKLNYKTEKKQEWKTEKVGSEPSFMSDLSWFLGSMILCPKNSVDLPKSSININLTIFNLQKLEWKDEWIQVWKPVKKQIWVKQKTGENCVYCPYLSQSSIANPQSSLLFYQIQKSSINKWFNHKFGNDQWKISLLLHLSHERQKHEQ